MVAHVQEERTLLAEVDARHKTIVYVSNTFVHNFELHDAVPHSPRPSDQIPKFRFLLTAMLWHDVKQALS